MRGDGGKLLRNLKQNQSKLIKNGIKINQKWNKMRGDGGELLQNLKQNQSKSIKIEAKSIINEIRWEQMKENCCKS